MLARPRLAPFHEGSNCRGRGVEDRHVMTFDEIPNAIWLGPVRRPFVHQNRCTVSERTIHDVTVACDPAHISGAEIHVVVTQVEHHLRRRGYLREVPAGCMKNSLGLAGTPRCVKDKQRMLTRQCRGLVARICRLQAQMPPMITTRFHRALLSSALHDEHVADTRRLLQCHISRCLQRNRLATTPCSILRNQELRAGIIDAITQGVTAESTEDHVMRGTYARTGEHRNHCLGHHTHVDRNNITTLNTQLFQDICRTTHFGVKLLVGQGAHIAGLAFPYQRGLGATPCAEMSIKTVHRNVGCSTNEPLRMRMLPYERFLPRRKPCKLPRLLFPVRYYVLRSVIMQSTQRARRADVSV